jgi:hypothetical protein
MEWNGHGQIWGAEYNLNDNSDLDVELLHTRTKTIFLFGLQNFILAYVSIKFKVGDSKCLF